MKTLKCQIYSDVICPWCLIGWTNLKAAAERLEGDIALEVSWLPFELNPDIPPEGQDRQAYLAAKFGGAERTGQIYARVAQAAEAAGLDLALDSIRRTPSTLAAHRLILLAEGKGLGTRLKETLFDRYFRQGQDIGAHAVLTEAAVSCGLDEAEVRAFLAGEEGVEPVRAFEQRARELGISGVPFFIVEGKYGLSGAQPPDVFAKALSEIAEAA